MYQPSHLKGVEALRQVNYLGEEGADCRLAAAASLCNPFDLVMCDQALEHGMGRVYSRSMGNGMRRLFTPHAALFRGSARFDTDMAAAATSVRDFDEAITRRSFGFPSVDAYYAASGSALRIGAVGVPLLCVQALQPAAMLTRSPSYLPHPFLVAAAAVRSLAYLSHHFLVAAAALRSLITLATPSSHSGCRACGLPL